MAACNAESETGIVHACAVLYRVLFRRRIDCVLSYGAVQSTAYGVHMSSRRGTRSPSAPVHQQQILGDVGGMAERATILTLLPPSPGPASSPLSCRDADEGGDMQPYEPHLSHLSSLWHLSHTRSTGTDVTTITTITTTTTTRCALPIVGQQPSVSRQNESQLSSGLIMSLLTKANSGISDIEKRDLSDAVSLAAILAGSREWDDDEATTP